jgi:hypothetical protein
VRLVVTLAKQPRPNCASPRFVTPVSLLPSVRFPPLAATIDPLRSLDQQALVDRRW